MIINTTFKYLESRCLRIKLTKMEVRLLLLLSDNNFHFYNEVLLYLYNYNSKDCLTNLYMILSRFKKKLGINLILTKQEGLILNNKILIDR